MDKILLNKSLKIKKKKSEINKRVTGKPKVSEKQRKQPTEQQKIPANVCQTRD